MMLFVVQTHRDFKVLYTSGIFSGDHLCVFRTDSGMQHPRPAWGLMTLVFYVSRWSILSSSLIVCLCEHSSCGQKRPPSVQISQKLSLPPGELTFSVISVLHVPEDDNLEGSWEPGSDVMRHPGPCLRGLCPHHKMAVQHVSCNNVLLLLPRLFI